MRIDVLQIIKTLTNRHPTHRSASTSACRDKDTTAPMNDITTSLERLTCLTLYLHSAVINRDQHQYHHHQHPHRQLCHLSLKMDGSSASYHTYSPTQTYAMHRLVRAGLDWTERVDIPGLIMGRTNKTFNFCSLSMYLPSIFE